MVKINGEELNVAGKTVSEYLANTNYDPKRIAAHAADIAKKIPHARDIDQGRKAAFD